MQCTHCFVLKIKFCKWLRNFWRTMKEIQNKDETSDDESGLGYQNTLVCLKFSKLSCSRICKFLFDFRVQTEAAILAAIFAYMQNIWIIQKFLLFINEIFLKCDCIECMHVPMQWWRWHDDHCTLHICKNQDYRLLLSFFFAWFLIILSRSLSIMFTYLMSH